MAATVVDVSTGQEFYNALRTAMDGRVINMAAGVYTPPATGAFKLLAPNVTINGDIGGGTVLTGSYDGLTFQKAKNATVRNVHAKGTGGRGFYAVEADNLQLIDCSGIECGISGILTSKSHYVFMQRFRGHQNKAQHGAYFSNHGMKPVIVDSSFEGNGRCGIQFNADLGQPLPPVYFEKGQINDLLMKGVVCKRNGLVFAGASANLLGCWNATVEDCEFLDGLAGGLSLSNDHDQSPAGLEYGSKNCTFRRCRITGKRGISLQNGSINAQFIDCDVQVTGGPCIDWDATSTGAMVYRSPWTPGVGKKIWSGPSGMSGIPPQPAPDALRGTTGVVPIAALVPDDPNVGGLVV